MILFHGTSFAHYESIMKRGILPRQVTGGEGTWVIPASGEDRVYLSNCFALYYAVSASEDDDLLVLAIDTELLDETQLVPDEDAIEQSFSLAPNKLSPMHGTEPGEERRSIAIDMARAMQGTRAWNDSIEAIGGCAHIGTIPPSAIVKAVRIDTSNAPGWFWSMCDTSASILSYMTSGITYRDMLEYMMGYRDSVRDQYEAARNEKTDSFLPPYDPKPDRIASQTLFDIANTNAA